MLERLLKHPGAHSFQITALVRSDDKAEKLKKLGIITAVGSFGDSSLVEKLVGDADIVFDMV